VLAGALGAALGGQPEAVPAHHAQHVEPHHPLGARDHVGRGVALGVADVQAIPRRIGKHVEHVVLGPRAIGRRLERLLALPERLPLGIDEIVLKACH